MARNVKTAAAALAHTTRATDGLLNVVAGLGLPSHDKRQHNTYAPVGQLSRMHLDSMYRSSWICKRIINTPAEDMTREWFDTVFDDPEGKNTKTIEQAEKRFGIKAKVLGAIRWARLYGGSVLIIGLRGEKLDQPLDVSRVRRGQLQYLHVLDRHRIAPTGQLTTDLESPNFGLPETYTVAESSVMVHWTRLLRFGGQPLPYFAWRENGMWDDSELQHVMDSVMDHDQAAGQIASMMFEANVDVVKVSDLTTLAATDKGAESIKRRFGLAAVMKSSNRMFIIDAGETYEKKSNSFVNLDKVLEKFQVETCAAADIPMTKLFGQSPGGLNATGESDLTNYYDRISSDQEARLLAPLSRLYEVVARSELGGLPDDFDIEFRPLWQIPASVQSDIDKKNMERDTGYITAGVLTEGTVARNLKAAGTYPEMTDEDVELAEELADEPPEPPEGFDQGGAPLPVVPADPAVAVPPQQPAAPAAPEVVE